MIDDPKAECTMQAKYCLYRQLWGKFASKETGFTRISPPSMRKKSSTSKASLHLRATGESLAHAQTHAHFLCPTPTNNHRTVRPRDKAVVEVNNGDNVISGLQKD